MSEWYENLVKGDKNVRSNVIVGDNVFDVGDTVGDNVLHFGLQKRGQ